MTQTTKQALAASFKELLAQKPFHKITISDITEQCGVNRMTFYYHFHDIYDLAGWAFQEELTALLNSSPAGADWKDRFLAVAWEMRRSRRLITNVCREIRREELERHMCELVESLNRPVSAQQAETAALDPEDRAFVVHFYTYALVGLLLEWIEDGMKTEPEELARRLDAVYNGGIRQAARALQAVGEKK